MQIVLEKCVVANGFRQPRLALKCELVLEINAQTARRKNPRNRILFFFSYYYYYFPEY